MPVRERGVSGYAHLTAYIRFRASCKEGKRQERQTGSGLSFFFSHIVRRENVCFLKRGKEQVVRISEFQVKDVVSVSDGRKLGNITDIEINLDSGRIEAIVIGGGGKLLGFFGKDEEVVVPWNNIVKIGEDVILVRYKEQQDHYYKQAQLEGPESSTDK